VNEDSASDVDNYEFLYRSSAPAPTDVQHTNDVSLFEQEPPPALVEDVVPVTSSNSVKSSPAPMFSTQPSSIDNINEPIDDFTRYAIERDRVKSQYNFSSTPKEAKIENIPVVPPTTNSFLSMTPEDHIRLQMGENSHLFSQYCTYPSDPVPKYVAPPTDQYEGYQNLASQEGHPTIDPNHILSIKEQAFCDTPDKRFQYLYLNHNALHNIEELSELLKVIIALPSTQHFICC